MRIELAYRNQDSLALKAAPQQNPRTPELLSIFSPKPRFPSLERTGRAVDSAPRTWPRLQALHFSPGSLGAKQSRSPIMAAEEADVDIEGDLVPAAAQSG